MAENKHTASNPITFTTGEVELLLREIEETGNRVYALLDGIFAMLPKDKEGNHDDMCVAKLVDMAKEEIGDVSSLTYFKHKLSSVATA